MSPSGTSNGKVEDSRGPGGGRKHIYQSAVEIMTAAGSTSGASGQIQKGTALQQHHMASEMALGMNGSLQGTSGS